MSWSVNLAQVLVCPFNQSTSFHVSRLLTGAVNAHVSAGVFALLQAYAFLQYLKDRLTKQEFQTLFFLGISLAAGVVFLTVIYLTYTGEPAATATASRVY